MRLTCFLFWCVAEDNKVSVRCQNKKLKKNVPGSAVSNGKVRLREKRADMPTHFLEVSVWNHNEIMMIFLLVLKKITDTAYTGSVEIVTFLLISHSIVYDETILRMKYCSTSAIHLLSLFLPYGTWLRFVTAAGRGDNFFVIFFSKSD